MVTLFIRLPFQVKHLAGVQHGGSSCSASDLPLLQAWSCTVVMYWRHEPLNRQTLLIMPLWWCWKDSILHCVMLHCGGSAPLAFWANGEHMARGGLTNSAWLDHADYLRSTKLQGSIRSRCSKPKPSKLYLVMCSVSLLSSCVLHWESFYFWKNILPYLFLLGKVNASWLELINNSDIICMTFLKHFYQVPVIPERTLCFSLVW